MSAPPIQVLQVIGPPGALALLLGAVGVSAVPAWRRARPYTLVALVATALALALALVWAALGEAALEVRLLHMTPQLWLALRVDAAGALYAATVLGLGLLALVHAFGYLADDPRPGRFYAFLMACLAATVGVAYAGNLLTFLLFYEAFSVLTYVLVVHEQTPAAFAAGAKYIGYVLVGGSLVLAGVVATFALVGDLDFVAGGMVAGAGATPAALRVTFACFVAGFGVKAALVPLHGWVPDAHPAAPAPFSALLSGVMVAAGGFGILRVVFDVFGADQIASLGVAPWLGAIATVTVLFGAVLALGQPDLKRRLAYSTISQMGYLALAASLLGATATAGGLVHLAHHAFLKGTLFFCAGVWIHAAGARRVDELRGMAARTPVTAAAFTVAALGMIGVPPLSGFVSKWFLGLGALEAGAGWALAVLLVGALLAAGYLLPVVHALYFATPEAGDAPWRTPEAARTLLLPIVVATAVNVALGLAAMLPGFPLDLARHAVAAWWGGG